MFLLLALLGLHRMRRYRRRFHLDVEVHHILPRQVFALGLVDGLEVDASANLLFMPTRFARVRTRRFAHGGGHAAYNAFVIDRLRTGADAATLQRELRRRLRAADPDLPWR